MSTLFSKLTELSSYEEVIPFRALDQNILLGLETLSVFPYFIEMYFY